MRFLSLLILITIVAPGCKLRFDVEVERDRILQRGQEWAQAVEDGNLDLALTFYGDEPMLFPPGRQAIRGREGVRQFLETSRAQPGFQYRWMPYDVFFVPHGRSAYAFSTGEVSSTGEDGKITVERYKGVTLWVHDRQRGWVCVLDVWNSLGAGEPAPEPAGEPKEAS